jgi:hypothetical protein
VSLAVEGPQDPQFRGEVLYVRPEDF